MEKISRGSFYSIVSAITCGGEKLMTAVDCVTGVLVNDPVSRLQKIVDDLCPGIECNKRLTISWTYRATF